MISILYSIWGLSATVCWLAFAYACGNDKKFLGISGLVGWLFFVGLMFFTNAQTSTTGERPEGTAQAYTSTYTR